jgi:hypothetical protein
MTLKQDAIHALIDAEFFLAWPADVVEALERASKTEGEIPAYAEKQVKWALREARNVERKCERDLAYGERNLSQADRKRLAR